jgi:sulfur carrier protein
VTSPGGPALVVVVNGQVTTVLPGSTLEGLLDQVEVDPKGVAIALDGDVVPRSRWPATTLRPGAHVEIVTAAAGG